VDKTLSIKENLQHNLAFALVQAEFLFPRRLIIGVLQKAPSFISSEYIVHKAKILISHSDEVSSKNNLCVFVCRSKHFLEQIIAKGNMFKSLRRML
jgi:hypothetical protein